MKKLSLLIIPLIMMGCAASYKPVTPSALAYPTQEVSEGLTYSYRFNVLAEAGNKKYAKRELKKDVKVLAIKVTNNTGRDLNFKNDIDILIGRDVVLPMEKEQIRQTLKQPAGLFMLWSLLWLNIENCDGIDCTNTPIPIGVGIGLGNTLAAGKANKNLETELSAFDILNSTIRNGETAYGLIGISSNLTAPIRLELK